MNKRNFIYSGLIGISALALTFFSLPNTTQQQLLPFIPKEILPKNISLGLDLQGGTQLDYNIDLRRIPEADKKNIINGVLNVITRRVNSLGVSETNIYTSNIGNETHIIVEIPGSNNESDPNEQNKIERAKQIVGKTIQLEFRAQKTTPDPNIEQNTLQSVRDFINLISANPEDFKNKAESESQLDPARIRFTDYPEFVEETSIIPEIASALKQIEPGKINKEPVEIPNELTIEAGQIVQQKTYNAIKLIDKKTDTQEIKTPKGTKVAHILISHSEANSIANNATRNKTEAENLAKEIEQKIKSGESFEDLAKQYSDDQSNSQSGGILTDPVTENSSYVKEFETAALALKEINQISQPIESPFGFHIIKALEFLPEKTENKTINKYKFQRLAWTSDDRWEAPKITGEQFVRADVVFSPGSLYPQVQITFTPEGGKLFEELTANSIGKSIGIFVGGQLISSPTVQSKIVGNTAVITGQFNLNTANTLAQDLNTGAIPAPITLVGEQTIGASLGQDALEKSLNAGLIGLILASTFMILYYRLPGLVASIALLLYTVILISLIKATINPIIAVIISLFVFGYLCKKIHENNDSIPEKLIAFILSCFILFFLTFILTNPIVMTLAGIAGVILSIGMALDANILIFERIREELALGRSLSSSIDIGFKRAWNSIRDSNFSSLITCAILFIFGSSIIQGFAFNLAAGVLISMFTAITITKTLLKLCSTNYFEKKLWLFGKKSESKKNFDIIKNRKIWYSISGVLITATILGLAIFELKLGMDFTGGTLLELKINQEITTKNLQEKLSEISKKLNSQNNSNENINSTNETSITSINQPLELEKAQIYPTKQGFIIKTKSISSEIYSKVISELKQHFPNLEEKRFITIGPTVGETMQFKAILALIVASIMITFYIALSFRKVPKSVGKWKFGITAIISLLHNITIMIGVYLILGQIYGVEIDALFITAILTIMGFSIHDTIVIFDRIRENLKSQKNHETFEYTANLALNESIARSLNTSITTLFTLLVLAIIGPDSIRFFTIALIIGITVGTYASIFIATPLLTDWQNLSKK